jgi:ubiquitin carboxyl-terminal hydrolase 34
MLPAYYGLLRLCCQQSRTLTRQLAGHQNLQWAFKNITPHPTQYNLAVDELFKLMALFVTKYPDSTQAELDQICVFRRQTLSAYLSGLDARVSWNTLVSALRILVENEEDRLFFVSNGGLTMCFEALLTLHSMYHEATACNVTEDLQDLLREIVRLVQALRQNCREQKKKYPQPGYFKGLPEVIRRLTTLLNTFNPPEMRKLTLNVLQVGKHLLNSRNPNQLLHLPQELVRCIPTEAIGILTPILTHCHIPSQQHSMGPLGTFFPRRNTKNSGNSSSWQSSMKNIPRPPRPMIQMNIPRTQAFTNVKGVDKEFDMAVERFYKPYHEFLDIFFRAAVTSNIFNENLVNLSLVTGIEAVGWHFNFFPTFWVGINKNKNTQR